MNHHQFDDDDKDEDERKKINLWKVSWLWFCDADGEKSDLKTSKIESNYGNNKKINVFAPKIEQGKVFIPKLKKKAFYIKLEKIKVFSIKFEHEKYSI